MKIRIRNRSFYVDDVRLELGMKPNKVYVAVPTPIGKKEGVWIELDTGVRAWLHETEYEVVDATP